MAAARRKLLSRAFVHRTRREKTAENALAAKGHVSCVPVFEGAPHSGKIIAFSPEQHTKSKFATSSVEDSTLRQKMLDLTLKTLNFDA